MISMTIWAKPYSINKLYYNNKGHGKTIAALEWSYNVLGQIHNYGDQLLELKKSWEEKKCGLAVSMVFHMPNLKTKSGDISKLSSDLSNVEKGLLDLLFLPKYHGTNVPYTALNLNLDDCWVTSLSSKKVYGAEYKIELTVALDE